MRRTNTSFIQSTTRALARGCTAVALGVSVSEVSAIDKGERAERQMASKHAGSAHHEEVFGRRRSARLQRKTLKRGAMTLLCIPESIMLMVFEYLGKLAYVKKAWSDSRTDIGILKYRLVSRAFNRYALESLQEINFCHGLCPTPICYDCGTSHSTLRLSRTSLVRSLLAFPLRLRILDVFWDVSGGLDVLYNVLENYPFLRTISHSSITRLNLFVDLGVISLDGFIAITLAPSGMGDLTQRRLFYEDAYSDILLASICAFKKKVIKNLKHIGMFMPCLEYIELILLDDDLEMAEIDSIAKYLIEIDHEFKNDMAKFFPKLTSLEVNNVMVLGQRSGRSRGARRMGPDDWAEEQEGEDADYSVLDEAQWA